MLEDLSAWVKPFGVPEHQPSGTLSPDFEFLKTSQSIPK